MECRAMEEVLTSPETPRSSRAAALGALAGASWVLALPPVAWWPLGPVAVALLLAAVEGQRWSRRAGVGALAGLVVFGTTLRWATIYTVGGYLVLTAVQTSFLAVATALVPGGRGRFVALPGAIVLAEMARHRWPLGGLPLSGLELTQAPSPWAGLSAYGGPYALVLLAAVIGAAAVCILRAPTWRSARRPLVAGLAVAAGASLAPAALGTVPVDRQVSVATVQGGGARGIPAVRSDSRAVFRRQVDAMASVSDATELVVWPEDVVDVPGPFQDSDEDRELRSIARRLGATLVVGVVSDAGDRPGGGSIRRFRNQAVAVSPQGEVVDVYDKVLRVPFGEYVPWRRMVARLADLSLVPREAVPGTGPPVLTTDVGRLGVSISFEGLFARHGRAAARAGGELHVIPTNAASYVTPDVPGQQVAAARLRAIENGRDVLITGPTGPSAIVDHTGRVLARSELELPAVLQATVGTRRDLTPYGMFGDTPVAVAAATLVAWGWMVPPRVPVARIYRRRRRDRRALWRSRPSSYPRELSLLAAVECLRPYGADADVEGPCGPRR
jgi:apolipoprotein N-acyltransferase